MKWLSSDEPHDDLADSRFFSTTDRLRDTGSRRDNDLLCEDLLDASLVTSLTGLAKMQPKHLPWQAWAPTAALSPAGWTEQFLSQGHVARILPASRGISTRGKILLKSASFAARTGSMTPSMNILRVRN